VPGTTIWWPASPTVAGEGHPGVAVVGLQAPLSFLNAENFSADIRHVLGVAKPALLVVEASGMLEIDFTAAQMLIDLIRQCGEDGVTLAIARLESVRAQQAFERFGLYDVLPKDRIFRSVDEAIRALAAKT
jgi:MFS superfamily sulfate permease-like transporter